MTDDAAQFLKESFERLGITVLVVPEVPTILIEGGALYPGKEAGRKLIEFERNLLKLQVSCPSAAPLDTCLSTAQAKSPARVGARCWLRLVPACCTLLMNPGSSFGACSCRLRTRSSASAAASTGPWWCCATVARSTSARTCFPTTGRPL